MKILHLIFLALIPICLSAQGQENADSAYSPPRAVADLAVELEMGFPIGNFRSGIDKGLMAGKGIGLYYRFPQWPVDIGMRFGNFSYDHVRREFEEEDVDYVQKTKNKIWIWYAAVRVEPPLKLPFNTYFEGSLGTRRFFTKTYSKEEGLVLFTDEEESVRFDQATLHSDWGLLYGCAAGLRFYLDYNVRLDLQVGYKESFSGRFYVDDDITAIQEEPLDNYEERSADFSMLSFKLGLSFLIVPD